MTATFEATARARKATRLVNVLREVGATPDDLTDQVWADATTAAGVRPPSEATKAIVADLLPARPTPPRRAGTLPRRVGACGPATFTTFGRTTIATCGCGATFTAQGPCCETAALAAADAHLGAA